MYSTWMISVWRRDVHVEELQAVRLVVSSSRRPVSRLVVPSRPFARQTKTKNKRHHGHGHGHGPWTMDHGGRSSSSAAMAALAGKTLRL